MPNIQGNKKIEIQPNDDKKAYGFTVTVCSAIGADDGFLPYGRTISSYTLKAYKYDETGTDASADLIDSSSRSNFVITVSLQWPTTNGAGRYRLTFVLTLDDGSKHEFDYGRVYCRDR